MVPSTETVGERENRASPRFVKEYKTVTGFGSHLEDFAVRVLTRSEQGTHFNLTPTVPHKDIPVILFLLNLEKEVSQFLNLERDGSAQCKKHATS
jgi:hypothetical protein